MAGQPGGMTYRSIIEPPLSARLRYYLGFRLPAEYRDWVEADIASPGWPLRSIVGRYVGVVVGLTISLLITDANWSLLFAVVLGPLLVIPIVYARREKDRARALDRHRRYWGG